MRIERATRISGWENECATGDCVAGDVWRRILGCDEHRLNQSMAVLGLLAGEFRDCIVTPEVAIATWKRPPLRRRASTTKVLAAGYGFVSLGVQPDPRECANICGGPEDFGTSALARPLWGWGRTLSPGETAGTGRRVYPNWSRRFGRPVLSFRIGAKFGELSPILRGSFSIALGMRPVQCSRSTLVQTAVRLGWIEEGFEVGHQFTLVGCDVAGRGGVVSLVGVDQDLARLQLPKCLVTLGRLFLSFGRIEYRLTLVGLLAVFRASLVSFHQPIQHQEVGTAARDVCAILISQILRRRRVRRRSRPAPGSAAANASAPCPRSAVIELSRRFDGRLVCVVFRHRSTRPREVSCLG